MRSALVAVLSLCLSAAAAAAPAPAFSLPDLDGRTVSLADYAGRVVVVDFWATWCAPCKQELPHLQRIANELGPQGLTVLAISTDDARDQPRIRPYVRREGLTMPVLLDPSSSVLGAYNPALTLPFAAIVGRDGQVVSVHAGYSPGDEVALREELIALLAATPPAPPAPPAAP